MAPSPHESFSLTVIEALTAGVPVLVNATCGATREHCEQSGAGLWFGDFAEFEAGVDYLTSDGVPRQTMRDNGRAYVEANFTWPAILDRYCGFLERFAGGVAAAGNGVP